MYHIYICKCCSHWLVTFYFWGVRRTRISRFKLFTNSHFLDSICNIAVLFGVFRISSSEPITTLKTTGIFIKWLVYFHTALKDHLVLVLLFSQQNRSKLNQQLLLSLKYDHSPAHSSAEDLETSVESEVCRMSAQFFLKKACEDWRRFHRGLIFQILG